MNNGGYRIRNKEEIHFLTFAVVDWVDVFSRKQYRDIVVDSLAYCQREKGLLLHGWCLMTNHIHMLASSREGLLSAILRDFKKFTSTTIIDAIASNKHESRRDWMLPIFKNAGQSNSRNTDYQFWRQDNQPKECYSPGFTVQKLLYTHNNPVEAGIVEKPEHYIYSSAMDYHCQRHCGLLKIEFI